MLFEILKASYLIMKSESFLRSPSTHVHNNLEHDWWNFVFGILIIYLGAFLAEQFSTLHASMQRETGVRSVAPCWSVLHVRDLGIATFAI